MLLSDLEDVCNMRTCGRSLVEHVPGTRSFVWRCISSLLTSDRTCFLRTRSSRRTEPGENPRVVSLTAAT